MSTELWKSIAQVAIDAYDVDIGTFQQNFLNALRKSTGGSSFANWVSRNPILFEILVRVLSAAIKPHARSMRDRGLLVDALADQLIHFPSELRSAFVHADDHKDTVETASSDPSANWGHFIANAIVGEHDHDLSSSEKSLIVRYLSRPDVLTEYLRTGREPSVPADIRSPALQRLEQIEREFPDEGRWLKLASSTILGERRLIAFYNTLLSISTAEAAERCRRSEMDFDRLAVEFNFSMTEAEQIANGVDRLLSRKDTARRADLLDDLLLKEAQNRATRQKTAT